MQNKIRKSRRRYTATFSHATLLFLSSSTSSSSSRLLKLRDNKMEMDKRLAALVGLLKGLFCYHLAVCYAYECRHRPCSSRQQQVRATAVVLSEM
jgi:hypothetical protein